jgi:hypothetical protein
MGKSVLHKLYKGCDILWTYAPLKRPLMPKAKVTVRQAKI